MKVESGFSFGAEVAKALGLEHTTHISIDIPLEGLVEVHAEMHGTERLRKVDWSKLKDNVQIVDCSWLRHFTERQKTLIENSVKYAIAGYGDTPDHDWMILVATMNMLLSEVSQ